MTNNEQPNTNELLISLRNYFRENIIENHIRNIERLSDPRQFNINPFTLRYLASIIDGEVTPRSLAKALIYPRALGTSINTTFGTQMQRLTSDFLPSLASTTTGIDIEFNDQVDGRKKYCQMKGGPNCINADDVATIRNHLHNVRRLARTNNLRIEINDLVIGVLYGYPEELNSSFRALENEFPVYIGAELWYRITGDENFYQKMIDIFIEAAEEQNVNEIFERTITELAVSIQEQDII